MRTAIILAGGRGNRFRKALNSDKLLARIGGEVVLRRTASVVADMAEDLILAVDEWERGRRYLKLLEDIADFRIVTDIEPSFSSPLMGFVSGIMASRGKYLIVIPGDAAYVKREELSPLIHEVESGNSECSVPVYEGYVQTLFQALLADKAKRIARLLLEYNWRKPDGFIRGSSNVSYLKFSPVSEGFSPFRTINSPEDIMDYSRRAQVILEGVIRLSLSDSLHLIEAPVRSKEEALSLYERLMEEGSFFWAGVVSSVWKGLEEISARAFMEEKRFMEEIGLKSLALHAEKDANRVMSRKST